MAITNKKIISLILIILSVLLVFTFADPNIAFAANDSKTTTADSGIVSFLKNPLASVIGGLGNLLISLTGAFLYYSGALFDLLIQYTIVEFGGNLIDLKIMASITKVWEAFRDIGNIVIIGMFVFVAISTILGIEEYGTKKMIARLLIVAVLINFSLFFTKAIIDASHITAKQFYSSIVNIAKTSSSPNSGAILSRKGKGDPIRQVGISGAFMQRTGITGSFDSKDLITKINKAGGSPAKVIFIYSILVSLLLFTVAIWIFGFI